MRSLGSNLKRFRNKSPPRKIKRYGVKILPMDENKTPLNIERGMTIISVPKALLLLVKYDMKSNIVVVINICRRTNIEMG